MTEVSRSSFAIVLGILGTLYWLVSFIIGTKLMMIVASSILIGLGTAVVYAYGKVAFDGMRRKKITAVELMATAYTLTWLGIVGGRVFNIRWRLLQADQPEYLHSYTLLLVLFVLSMGGVIAIMAPRPVIPSMRISNWLSLAIAISIASALVGAALAIEIVIGLDALSYLRF